MRKKGPDQMSRKEKIPSIILCREKAGTKQKMDVDIVDVTRMEPMRQRNMVDMAAVVMAHIIKKADMKTMSTVDVIPVTPDLRMIFMETM